MRQSYCMGPPSYEVKVGGRGFVYNRRQLIKFDEHVVEDTPEAKESTGKTDATDPPNPPENTSTLPQTEEMPSVTSS